MTQKAHEPSILAIGPEAVLDSRASPVDSPDSANPTGKGSSGQHEGETSTSPRSGSVQNYLPKILRNSRLILSSRSFYFSYDIDLTRRLAGFTTDGTEQVTHESLNPLVRRLSACLFALDA